MRPHQAQRDQRVSWLVRGRGLKGGSTTRFVTLRRGQTAEADRHAADHDRVAISNVGDLAGQGAARTLRGVSWRRGQQCSQEEDRSQLHLSARA
jgi:hypothetical protein